MILPKNVMGLERNKTKLIDDPNKTDEGWSSISLWLWRAGGAFLTAMDSCKWPFTWGVKYVSHCKLTFHTSSTSLSLRVARWWEWGGKIFTNFLPRWKAWPFISSTKCISYIIIQFQDHAKWRFWLNFSMERAQGGKHHSEWFFRWGSLGSFSLFATCLSGAAELQRTSRALHCWAPRLHIFFSPCFPPTSSSLCLSDSSSPML